MQHHNLTSCCPLSDVPRSAYLGKKEYGCSRTSHWDKQRSRQEIKHSMIELLYCHKSQSQVLQWRFVTKKTSGSSNWNLHCALWWQTERGPGSSLSGARWIIPITVLSAESFAEGQSSEWKGNSSPGLFCFLLLQQHRLSTSFQDVGGQMLSTRTDTGND